MGRHSLSLFLIAILMGCLTAMPCSGQQYGDTAHSQIDTASQPQSRSQSDPTAASQSNLYLKLIAKGFTAPVEIISPDDGSGRIFIVDQAGLINVLTSNGTLLKSPFLDLRSRMIALSSGYEERGLLGLAFHPDFKENGRIFVFYSTPLRPRAPQGWDHTDRLSEFNISRDDLDRADPGSEQILMEIDHPQPNNNGGSIAFGPDGYLYIPVGDGGGSDDVGVGHPPEGNAQNLSTLLGKVLRIDVNNIRGISYGIPGDNPFAGRKGARPEIFAYGLRNPDISFDSGGNGSIFATDPGQMRWEEVDIITRGGNYGWNIKEGSHCFNVQDRSIQITTCRSTGYLDEPLIDPVIEYSSGQGQPITGGHIYRGSDLPWLAGHYIFGYRTRSYGMPDGGLMDAEPDGNSSGGGWIVMNLNASINGLSSGEYILSLGEGPDHELYVGASAEAGPAGSTGRIYKIVMK